MRSRWRLPDFQLLLSGLLQNRGRAYSMTIINMIFTAGLTFCSSSCCSFCCFSCFFLRGGGVGCRSSGGMGFNFSERDSFGDEDCEFPRGLGCGGIDCESLEFPSGVGCESCDGEGCEFCDGTGCESPGGVGCKSTGFLVGSSSLPESSESSVSVLSSWRLRRG